MIAPIATELGIPQCIAIGEAARRLTAWRDGADRPLPQPLPRPEQLATLQYTGGTTGR